MKPIKNMKDQPGYENWSKRGSVAYHGFEAREDGSHKTQVIHQVGYEKGLIEMNIDQGYYEVEVSYDDSKTLDIYLTNIETDNTFDLFVGSDVVPQKKTVTRSVRSGGNGVFKTKVEIDIKGPGYFYGRMKVADMRDSDLSENAVIFRIEEVA